jgi:hypothetical protein
MRQDNQQAIFSLQAGYSIYENRDNGHVMSKEEQKEWNVKKDPKLGETEK